MFINRLILGEKKAQKSKVKKEIELVKFGVEFFFSSLLYVTLFVSGSLFYISKSRYDDVKRQQYYEEIAGCYGDVRIGLTSEPF